jgi:hypothetical protein
MKHVPPILFFFLIAIILRWPTIPYWDAVPMEANFPLHALAAFDLSKGGSPFINMHLEWPIGAPIRYLAWPLLILATPINWVLDPIPAFNLAIVLWLTIQGYGIYWLLSQFHFDQMNRYAAATCALLAPQILVSLGNGQFENIAPFPLLICYWAASTNKGWVTFLGLMACCFSSPYIGIIAILLTILSGYKSFKTWWVIGLVLGITYSYYGAVSDFSVHESTIPAPAHTSEKATLLGLLSPTNIAENGGVPLDGPWQRIRNITSIPEGHVYDNRWPWLMATAGSYIGWLWVILGFSGLWVNRKNKHIRTFIIWGCACLILAFGNSLQVLSIEIPMPWSLSTLSNALSQMQATSRFLVGFGLMLALGMAAHKPKKLLLLLIPFCVLESLLFSPAYWPIKTRAPLRSTLLKSIEKPIIFWPAAPTIASHKVTMTSLVLQQPLALFSEKGSSMPNAEGQISSIGTGKNRSGQELTDWFSLVTISGGDILLQFRDITGNKSQQLQKKAGECDTSFCIWKIPQ